MEPRRRALLVALTTRTIAAIAIPTPAFAMQAELMQAKDTWTTPSRTCHVIVNGGDYHYAMHGHGEPVPPLHSGAQPK